MIYDPFNRIYDMLASRFDVQYHLYSIALSGWVGPVEVCEWDVGIAFSFC